MAGVEEFEQHRRYIGAVAYRLLGSLADAEDAVQEAWLRWSEVDAAAVQNARAYLTTVVTRLCYDQLGSARARRETYFGEWIPEPLVDEQSTPQDRAERSEEVSFAMMVVLERLSPAERAAFVLHDVFGVEFAQIAQTLERSDEAVRQLASRARKQVKERSPRSTVDRAAHRDALRAFTDAVTQGDIIKLMQVLDPDVVWHSDGGGIVSAGPRPVRGAAKVARLALGLMQKYWVPGSSFAPVEVDGDPGLAVFLPGGQPAGVFAFCVADGRITESFALVNPEKLAHLGL